MARSPTPRVGEGSRDELLAAWREAKFFVRDFARVPAKVRVGAVEVGPGTFLLAMAQAVREPQGESSIGRSSPPDEHSADDNHDGRKLSDV